MIFYKQSNARRTAVEAKSNRSQVVNTALAHFRSKLIWSALDVTYTSRYNRLILGLNYSINRYKYYLTNIYVVDEKFGSEKKFLESAYAYYLHAVIEEDCLPSLLCSRPLG